MDQADFVIQCHNELRDLEVEMLRMVCNGVEIEPVLQDIIGEKLIREPTLYQMTGWISRQGGSGRGRGRLSLMPPKCRLSQGYGSKPDLQATSN